MTFCPRAAYLAVPLSALALLAAGCGGDSESEETPEGEAPAPAASAFPKADGRTLEAVAAEGEATDQIVASPAGGTYEPGDQRFGFGLFDVGGPQIGGAEVAIYASQGPKGEAIGPFPASAESMETEPEFVAQTTASDPESAQVVYVSEIPLDEPGEWRMVALVREGDGFQSVLLPSINVSEQPKIPAVGEKAPSLETPTAEEVGADIESIDTRVPPSTMHEESLSDVLGSKPVVLLFATPALCLSRVCGPVVDVAEQVKDEYGDDVAFIHQEIYEDNKPPKLREQVEAYGLQTEPWLFVIDEDGRITTRIEGAFGLTELERAVERVAG